MSLGNDKKLADYTDVIQSLESQLSMLREAGNAGKNIRVVMDADSLIKIYARHIRLLGEHKIALDEMESLLGDKIERNFYDDFNIDYNG